MISVVGAKQDQRESGTRTLGDVLYVSKAKVRVSEKDWVRLVQSIAAGDQLALHSLYEQTHRIVWLISLAGASPGSRRRGAASHQASHHLEASMAIEVVVGPPLVTINRGETVVLSEADGCITAYTDQGMYSRDTRYVSNYEIFADGERWILQNSGAGFRHSQLQHTAGPLLSRVVAAD